MALKDFTLGVEEDVLNRLAVTSDTITITNLDRDETAYVYFDEGVDAIDGDFEHLLEVYEGGSSTGSQCWNWALGNGIGDYTDIKNLGFLGLSRYKASSSIVRLQIYEIVTGGASYNTNWNGSTGTAYYLKFIRDEAVGTFGTLYCYIYSDPDRTVLLTTLSLALHEKKDFRYLYPVVSEGSTIPNESYNGYVKNLEIVGVEAVTIPPLRRGLGRGLMRGIGRGL